MISAILFFRTISALRYLPPIIFVEIHLEWLKEQSWIHVKSLWQKISKLSDFEIKTYIGSWLARRFRLALFRHKILGSMIDVRNVKIFREKKFWVSLYDGIRYSKCFCYDRNKSILIFAKNILKKVKTFLVFLSLNAIKLFKMILTNKLCLKSPKIDLKLSKNSSKTRRNLGKLNYIFIFIHCNFMNGIIYQNFAFHCKNYFYQV